MPRTRNATLRGSERRIPKPPTHAERVKSSVESARLRFAAFPTAEDEIRQHVEYQIKSNGEIIERFKVKLAELPMSAFEWADAAVEASAGLLVWTEIQQALTEHSLTVIAADFEREAHRLADEFPRSTSVMSNLVENRKRVAVVSAARYMRRLLDGRMAHAANIAEAQMYGLAE